jgi:hypothetical protein
MAQFYDDTKFNLKQDWYWSKVIGKRDELQYQSNEEEMSEVLMEYLELDDLADFTEEHLAQCEELVRYLETPYSEGGAGYEMETSAHFYALWYTVSQWVEQWHEGSWQDYYG